MPSQRPNLDQLPEPSDSAEVRMRLALGLGARPAAAPGGHATPHAGPVVPQHETARQRRRFAQDGEVPVVILHRAGRDGDAGAENRLAALTTDLREERAARLKSDRALEEANNLVQSLRTKLKHTEMTYEERLRGEGEARAQIDQLLAQEREARQRAETRAAEAELALSLLQRQLDAAAAAASAPVQPKRDLFDGLETPAPAAISAPKRRMAAKAKPEPEPKIRREAEAEDEDDKPIEWWLPSFRAAQKKPARRKRTAG